MDCRTAEQKIIHFIQDELDDEDSSDFFLFVLELLLTLLLNEFKESFLFLDLRLAKELLFKSAFN